MAKPKTEEWITSKLAAEILTKNSGHQISDAYVRLLGKKGKLDTKRIDARTKLYKRSPRVAQRDGESAEKEPANGYEQGVSPRRVIGKREIQLG